MKLSSIPTLFIGLIVLGFLGGIFILSIDSGMMITTLRVKAKAEIYQLDDAIKRFKEHTGDYPHNLKEWISNSPYSNNSSLIDPWEKEYIVIYPEDYDKHKMAQSYEENGNKIFYNMNSFQIISVNPDDGEILGNFSALKK